MNSMKHQQTIFAKIKAMTEKLFFSVMFFILFSGKAQIILRNSDYKKFDSVTISRDGKNTSLKSNALKSFKFEKNDKIFYDNKLLDFYSNPDSLIFFDNTKTIEEVRVNYENSSNKKEKSLKSTKKNEYAVIFPNNEIATFVQINTKKKTYIKSFSIFPVTDFIPRTHNDNVTVKIKLLGNKNGLPDNNKELIAFESKISDLKIKKKDKVVRWEFVLPKTIKYPKEGFFVVFFQKSLEDSTFFQINKDSDLLEYYPNEGWKSLNLNGYYYELKILQ